MVQKRGPLIQLLRAVRTALAPARRLSRAYDRLTAPVRALYREPSEPDIRWDAWAVYSGRAWPGGEASWQAALDRLVGRFPRPIHWKRWPACRRVLVLEAEAHHVSVEAELRNRIVAGIIQALHGLDARATDALDPKHPGIGDLTLQGRPEEFERRLRATVGRLVTEDLLGPGYARAEASIERRVVDVESLGASDADLAALALSARALTAREAELLLELARAGGVIADAARELEIAPSTARTHVERIRAKLATGV